MAPSWLINWLYKKDKMIKHGGVQTTTTPATVFSPCCRQAKDTEVSAAVPLDYRAASSLRLWDYLLHHLHSSMFNHFILFFIYIKNNPTFFLNCFHKFYSGHHHNHCQIPTSAIKNKDSILFCFITPSPRSVLQKQCLLRSSLYLH